ncbi:MAG: outer membrane protein assembly factor, partial [uncultured bacterium]
MSLRSFYLDHGYLNFQVVSRDVKQLPNGVAITVQVSEGPVYHLSGYRLAQVSVPDVLLPNIKKILMQLKVGDVFSRKKIIDVTKQVGDALANHGYAFPEVSPIPQLDQSAHTVFLNFNITAGRRVYVRNIHVVGDTRTSGIVIRSQLRQMEGSLYSLKDTKESERRIKNLGYLDHVEISTAAVPSDNNQVDLTYHVHEVN